ncbi:MAG: tetratricopeptide repeat protein [Limisphaerales bacterium]
MSKPGSDRPNFAILTNRFLSSSQWDRALETAHEWLAQEPENSRAHLAAGQSLVNLERYHEAEPHLLASLKGKPRSGLAWHCLSIVQFHQKRFAAADESAQKAISLNPNNAFHWYHLAWMLYKQGDSRAALKYAEKARQLDPRNASILNLVALCSPKDRVNASRRLEQYHEALALNPENAEIHNNIGVHYLNFKDLAAAEASFRRALFFKPTMKVARKNLFLVLKRRDKVYRALCAPRDLVLATLWRRPRNWRLYLLLVLPVAFLVFQYFIALLGLWCLFVWPMVKAYEYLTIGDLRAQAGDIGAKRGGLFNYRLWPLKLRLGLFGLLLALFWGGFTLIIAQSPLLKSQNFQGFVVTPLVIIGFLALLTFIFRARMKRGRRRWRRDKKNAQIEQLLKQKAKPAIEHGIGPNE